MASVIDRPRVRAVGLLPFAAVLIGAALTGCASGDAGAAPSSSATPDASSTPPVAGPVSGSGPTGFPGVDFTIPDDARSVVVDFECTGGSAFSLELGDSMMLGQAPLAGTCEGATELSWPIIERTGATLSVTVPDGVEWVASPTFSVEEFTDDPALAVECAQFSEVYSALVNADSGYTSYGAFDANEWRSRVDEAAADLGVLASSAHSLGDAFARVHAVVIDPGRTVGGVLTETAQGLIGDIGQECDANQTPLIIQAEFGG